MMTSSLATLPPGLWLMIAGLALPFVPRAVRQALLILAPAGTIALVWLLPDALAVNLVWLGTELQPLRVDDLSRLFGLVFAIMALGAGVFSLRVDSSYELAAAFVYAGGAVSVVFAGDWLTLFVFWEVMAIGSSLLIWYGSTDRSYGAGMRYAGVHFLGGVLLMAGIAGEVLASGSTLITTLDDTTWPRWLILAGVLINVGAPPLQAWVADAYPESSWAGMTYLSAFTTKAAVYLLIRAFPGVDWLVYVGLFMIFYGLIYALLETEMRRILAYSLVTQAGFMVTGVGIGTETALNGAAAHAFVCVIYGGLLVMTAGAVLKAVGRRRTTELGGLARVMPVTCICCVIGALSISSVPLTSGFPTKSLISEAAGQEKLLWVYLGLLAGSVGVFIQSGLMYPWLVFFQAPGQAAASDVPRPAVSAVPQGDGMKGALDAPFPMRLAMIGFAALCILIGVAPGLLYGLLPYDVPFEPYKFEKVLTQVQVLLFATLGFLALVRFSPRTNTVTLDLDWFYRALGRQLGATLQQKAIATETRFGAGALMAVKSVVAALYRHHGPDGVMGRQWHTGNMAFWTTMLLGISLVASLI